ncbi:oxidoreductase [Bifidobacterium eulemuris]|uniref:SDR family NAD(P)-dependent oxidoreductase n=1 Tax=Bifidobacterium eulemuris TaxID=1765219 RepID=A0A261GC96_9BIFI|nr:oxidoreductase [Bifidobacterium eulemuris]OZG69059.1 short-chain dehydrogenase/reductase [Bifidobacterium eulemuris]QOL31415.1 SDR family NAD(P)-dependent oxidoreductase [Bifidobacterium eulemuris]
MSQKVVLVTGASSGFGKGAAKALLDRNYVVYASSRRLDRLKDLEQEGAIPLPMDITNPAEVNAGIRTIMRQSGRIDALVNSAGYGGYGAMEDVPLEEARKQFDVNVFGLAMVTKAVLPHMRENGGNIVNLSSGAGFSTFPMGGWYSASKHAVEALSDALRCEVERFGIHVSLIEPGSVKTEFMDVAMRHFNALKHGEAYQEQALKFKDSFIRSYENAPTPEVVVEAIVKAVTSDRPKTRYKVAGASLLSFMKKTLPDKAFDAIGSIAMGQ